MKILSKLDFVSASVTGLTAGVVGYLVLNYLGNRLPLGLSPALLVIVVPILWILGVQFGYFLGQWMGFFDQFGKFAAIGFTNFAIYSGVLNLEEYFSNITRGQGVTIMAAVAFIIATIHSYAWNKYWAFSSGSNKKTGRELVMFWVISAISLVINSGTVSFVVNYLSRPGAFTAEQWLNIGGVTGSAVALLFSFIGFRMIVFKRTS